ncbi:hypothetical protein EB796_023206 [Bugula neritina]|uniref:Caspase family p10 domain-containing protein n=1 Tax=Bugula neritina TaxID=10212 RepID=A0A7J7IY60_BUGNE|nr:hypothetical protein EB796_023206 [Bugula neritina]
MNLYFVGFLAVRHEVYGSLMIRALVSTMYKHAGHRHMCEIFKNVQQKVRKTCLKRQLHEGQLVVTYDTLTHGRQLYLFPGFNGHRRRE